MKLDGARCAGGGVMSLSPLATVAPRALALEDRQATAPEKTAPEVVTGPAADGDGYAKEVPREWVQLAFSGNIHQRILSNVLRRSGLSRRDQRTITRANRRQDAPAGQLRPEYHVDGARSFADVQRLLRYVAQQYQVIRTATTRRQQLQAWGRITHAVQDLYSHSNYVEIYARVVGKPLSRIRPRDIPSLPEVMANPKYARFKAALQKQLRSGTYKHNSKWNPDNWGPNSHRGMNKDRPGRRGHRQAVAVAERHTRIEWTKVKPLLKP
jgi:hypothetical protein